MSSSKFKSNKTSDPIELQSIAVNWKSPSNIALIKYWGKHGRQFPSNPSVSFTLNKAHSTMELKAHPKSNSSEKSIDLELYFEEERNIPFEDRVRHFLEEITDIFPFLDQWKLQIYSSNSFPHSSGIASSASSMSALALCLCELENKILGIDPKQDFLQKASYVARQASGSACRSVYGIAALWGKTAALEKATDEHAVSVEDIIHPVFKSFRDAILVVSDRPKSVSSSAGHSLMNDHIFSEKRFEVAESNLQAILSHLRDGNVPEFGKIVESEALMLHAMMMTSNPSYLLFEPETVRLIHLIRNYREETGYSLFFTLDAGPNIHLLYPEAQKDGIESFVKAELLPHCVPGCSIFDECGPGPEKIQATGNSQ